MKRQSHHLQRSLFDEDEPPVVLAAAQMAELATLVETQTEGSPMTKITAEHLARSAYVYIRQSTHDQLVHNHQSRRRQYGRADRARRCNLSAPAGRTARRNRRMIGRWPRIDFGARQL
jgi:hypothetical protein